MAKHPQLKKLAAEKGLTAKYLVKKCKQAVPSWRLRPMPEDKSFTRNQKKGRLSWAMEAIKRPMAYWLSTIFCDEHTFYRHPIPLPCIHVAGQRRRVPDKRLKRWKWQHPKLHFLYGVHWKLGVLGPYWIHDCTGWRRAKQWEVSRSPPHPLPTWV